LHSRQEILIHTKIRQGRQGHWKSWEIRINLDYSRVEANPPHPNIKVEEVVHEAVVNYREGAYNEADVVRSDRPKGKKCR